MKNIYYLIAISCIVFSSLLNAQWIRINGPSGSVHSFAVSGTNLFAGTVAGVFLPPTMAQAGLRSIPALDVYALAVSGTNLFAGTDGGVFLSTNNGTSWTAVNSGLTNTYCQCSCRLGHESLCRD